jgi:3-oxoacid CoA-transferase A subunit
MSSGGTDAPSKLVELDRALDGIEDGMTVMVGGWGECGTPHALIRTLAARGHHDLTLIITGSGPSDPLHDAGAVSHVITSFGSYAGRAGAQRSFEQRVTSGAMTVELCSQGVLAERIRAGGAGIPAFYVDEGAVGVFTSTGERREIDGRTCVLETALRADVSLLLATVADPAGNLYWRGGERNFNDPMAYAADLVVVQASELYDIGWLPPEQIMVPGLVVDRVVAIEPEPDDT